MRRRLEYRTPYAMRRHKAWRGGSNAQQSCVPATALESNAFFFSSTWDHIDVDFKSSAVAGTQLCCALDKGS